MPMISRWLKLFVILALLGCGSREKHPEGLIVTPGGSLPATIVSVNPTARFAVLRFPIGQLPEPNRRMSAYRNGLKVADLKISEQRRDIYAVADVIAGECRAGDEVRAD